VSQNYQEQTKITNHDTFSSEYGMGRCTTLTPYGPAIWGACPAGAKRMRGHSFYCHGTNFIECWRDRGTSLINGREIVPVDEG